MFFNSIEFALFLPITFLLYWFVFNKNLRIQNIFLLLASYFFYGWWDWRFLSLIIFSSLTDYILGLKMNSANSTKNRKIFLMISIILNLGLLGVFKYFNFFIENFYKSFQLFGMSMEGGHLNIILPLGISFYTFQTLSYTIDVYRKKIKATEDPIEFLAFVSFFPQLVAGPIERAMNLLPQFQQKRIFEYHKAVDGLRQILLGLFKKIVIADNCAVLVNDIFSTYGTQNGSTLLVGAILFSFQIYGDFSGYSDIAIGTARLFGINLRKNFSFPYFSRNIAEFWRRWHISLTSWFRDYLYIPLGGSKRSKYITVRNVFIVFIVSGIWHGANWTFLVWGLIHASLFLPLLLFKRNRIYHKAIDPSKRFPGIIEAIQISFTFLMISISWIFFRSDSLSSAISYISILFSPSLFSFPAILDNNIFIIIFCFMVLEWIQRDKEHALEFDSTKIPKVIRWIFYYLIVLFIFLYQGDQQEFIYFQF
ncbi:MAG: membrane-bound O-acyltransferase family protein [Planctomycetota bacterium]|nr:MAG: membrane-bound O-acyltransferase family protein [Planctomycetota bacterium]